jgi:hypothetical protein
VVFLGFACLSCFEQGAVSLEQGLLDLGVALIGLHSRLAFSGLPFSMAFGIVPWYFVISTVFTSYFLLAL